MAYSFLSAPGEKNGPCEGSCEHEDCAWTRGVAESLCPLCDNPIGYGERFYQPEKDGPYVHYDCEMEKEENAC